MTIFFTLLIFLCLMRTVCQFFLPSGALQMSVDAFMRLATLLTLLRCVPAIREALPW